MSLMIGIATYDGKIHSETVKGLLQTAHFCATQKIGITVEVRSHDAFIGKARSIIAEKFLASGFHDLLFVDADVGFTVHEVIKVCKAPADFVLGLYRMKIDGPDETKIVKYPGLMADPVQRHEVDPFLIRLMYGPAGFMRIRRPVLEAMMKKWPTEHYMDDAGKIHDFFPAGRVGNNFTGEDISFCNRALECGFDIWGVQGLKLDHYGEKKWPSEWIVDEALKEPMREAA